MTCSQAQPLLPDYAAGAATPAERRAVESHLDAGCPACREELAGLLDAAAQLLGEEPLPTPPALLRSRLLETIDQRAAPTAPLPAPGRRRLGTLLVVAASLAAIVFSVATLRSREAESRAVIERLAESWRGEVKETERSLGVPGARLVSLPVDAFSGSVVTHVLYDSLSRELHVWATHNPIAREKDPNWAWLLDEGGAVVARGELKGASLGRLAAVLDAGELTTDTARVLLTIEPEAPEATPGDEVVEQGVLELK